MVGNWPHSILTLPRTAVTKVLILPLAKVSQIARALHLYIFKIWWTFSSLICVGNVLSNLVNFSTNVSNFPSVWRRGGWAIKCWWRTRVRRRRGNRDDGCEMVDEGEGGLVGKKEDIWGSIIGGQLGKHQSSSEAIWASLKGVRKTTLVFRQQFW